MRDRIAYVALILVALAAGAVPANALRTINIGGHPYKVVSTLPELAAAIAHRPSGTFALGSDYDASVDGTYVSAPIPTTFTGKLEGLGHTISNLSIGVANPQALVGLFAHIGIGGVVRNINLSNASIQYHYTHRPMIGSVAGENEGSIVNVQMAGSIVSPARAGVGGLVGLNFGSIVRSSADVTVSSGAQSYVGGLVGVVSGGMIKGSHASGPVSGGKMSTVGGLAGSVSQGTILNSYATNQVLTFTGGRFGLAGGLVGSNSGVIAASFSTGSVEAVCCGIDTFGGVEAGGLIGENNGSVQNAYSTGAVETGSGTDRRSVRVGGCGSVWGGLLGVNQGIVANAYSTGEIGGGNTGTDDGMDGGFTGCDPTQQIMEAYWDLDTSGVTDPSLGAGGNPPNDPGITGMTTAHFQSGLPAGFDPLVWGQSPDINGGFPYLLANPPP